MIIPLVGDGCVTNTFTPVHDQSITAPAKNYRRSINTQIIICAHARRVVTVGRCWPGNRNDVVVARHTVAHLLTGGREILGDGGYRGINTIATPRRDRTGRIIRDQHWREHRRIRARVEHIVADSKTGRYCVNADAAATPSSTASKSSPDSGTLKPTTNYGSTLSATPSGAVGHPAAVPNRGSAGGCCELAVE